MIKKSSILIFGAMIASAFAARFCYGFYETGQTERLCINEIMGKSVSYLYEGTGARERWIEIFNGTSEDINMGGYGLTNDMDYPYRYRFPDITLESGGFLVVYATGLKGEDGLYADFELNPRGEAVALTDPDGNTVDKVMYDKCVTDSPYGRKPDGGKFALLNRATKGQKNESYVSRFVETDEYSSEAGFSHEEGYQESPFYLELSSSEDEVIYYTLDGTEPTIRSKVYREPIFIEDPSSQPNRYAAVRTTERGTLLSSYGSEKVKKAAVVRTRTARGGRLSSKISTRTYFVGEKPALMTVSLVTEPGNLFDYFDGIYVPGYIYGRYIRSSTVKSPALGNFTLRGKGMERPVSATFFEEGKAVLNQDAGLRITAGRGNNATSPVKSLQLYASYKQEESGMNFPASLIGGTRDTGYRTLVLRTRGEIVANAMIDVYVNRLVGDTELKVQTSRPVSVYINGEYWGAAHLRDKIDQDFIEEKFGIQRGNCTILKYQIINGFQEIILKHGSEEDLQDYLALLQYADTHDLSVKEHYEYVGERLDLEDFIKNYVIRLFLVCRDWPDNNVRMFRAISPDGSEYGDGRWRTILYDNDFACLDYDADMIKYVLGEDKRMDNRGYERPFDGADTLFRALMENAEFRTRLKDQYEEYKTTIFQKDNMNRVLDEVFGEMGDEIKNHSVRWSRHANWLGRLAERFGAESSEMDQWEEAENYMERIRIFIDKRQEYMDREMEEIYARYGHE